VKNLQFALDLSILVLAFLISYLLRFDFTLTDIGFTDCLLQLPLVVTIQFISLNIVGVHSFFWRFVGLAETKVFFKALCYSLIPIFALRILLPEELRQWRVPISIMLIDAMLAIGGVLLLRIARRISYETFEKDPYGYTDNSPKSVFLIGAGRAGLMVAKEIMAHNLSLNIKGFIDDDRAKQGLVINGIKVIGTTHDIPDLVKRFEVDHVIITISYASRKDIRRIISTCENVNVRVKIIPTLHELLQTKTDLSKVRDVQIQDLLGRNPVTLETSKFQFLRGKVVLVTGAGGSIGSELVRQVSSLNPKQLILVDKSEIGLFNLERELRNLSPGLEFKLVIADIGDKVRMRNIMSTYAPGVVLHAAAHKHVPLMEHNSAEAIKNNSLSTYTLGHLAGQFNVEVFVLISTDKAVRPRSIMGASKRVAEMITQHLNAQYRTRFVAVRFGNVIGSTGSVIEIFKEQISNGGPVTVTDKDMMRYFMTIPEASQLVLHAAAIGTGGEVFTLDMGEPVKILDLAKDLITLSGLRPYEDIDIIFTGVRPGEKILEELSLMEDCLQRTEHPKIFRTENASISNIEIQQIIQKLESLCVSEDDAQIRAYLSKAIPESQELNSEYLTPAVSFINNTRVAKRTALIESSQTT
jgi:FlaA1/EpsC-like NDP-sugar epimerase